MSTKRNKNGQFAAGGTKPTTSLKMTQAQLDSVMSRRKSNASGIHADRRTKRLRDRGAQTRAAINESL